MDLLHLERIHWHLLSFLSNAASARIILRHYLLYRMLQIINKEVDVTMKVILLLLSGLKYDQDVATDASLDWNQHTGLLLHICFLEENTIDYFAATHHSIPKSNTPLKTKAINLHTDLNDDSLVQPIKVTLSTTTLIWGKKTKQK